MLAPADVVHMLVTDVGTFPLPPEMIEATKGVRWVNGWPDMRTTKGKRWAKLFRAFAHQKMQEWLKETHK